MKKKVKDKYSELYSSDYSSFIKQSKPGSHYQHRYFSFSLSGSFRRGVEKISLSQYGMDHMLYCHVLDSIHAFHWLEVHFLSFTLTSLLLSILLWYKYISMIISHKTIYRGVNAFEFVMSDIHLFELNIIHEFRPTGRSPLPA